MHKIRWNPNLTPEERVINRNREMTVLGLHLWRADVFKRDMYECQVCHDKSHKRIVAHHKEAWGINKDLRLIVDNGITLCSKCHKEFHSRYGWGKNTKAQWDEFSLYRKGVAA
jgi:hypothetical protein